MNVCGPQVARLRNQLEWSQPQLAAKCQMIGWDVSRDIIARIEGQTRLVRDSELATLAKVLNVSIDDLYPCEIHPKTRKK